MEIEYFDAVSNDVDRLDYWISGSEFRKLQKLYSLFCAVCIVMCVFYRL